VTRCFVRVSFLEKLGKGKKGSREKAVSKTPLYPFFKIKRSEAYLSFYSSLSYLSSIVVRSLLAVC